MKNMSISQPYRGDVSAYRRVGLTRSLADLEDITYTGGWLTNEFWHWLGT
jgi:hypothetical protein